MFAERAVNIGCAGNPLSAILHPGAHNASLGMLIIVGGPQYRVGSHRQFVHLARHLADAGIPVMRFDVTGMGDSEGQKRSFDNLNRDIQAAMDSFMVESEGLEEVVLWGLCDGASAALIYAPIDCRIKGLVLVNPWLENDVAKAQTQLFDYYLRRLFSPEFWRKLINGRVDLRGSAVELGSTVGATTGRSEITTDTQQYQARMLTAFEQYQQACLIVLSGMDLTAREFERQFDGHRGWRKAQLEKRLLRRQLAAADHTFSNSEAKKWLASATYDFVAQLAR
ncbi:MAG: exosortase A-associated hydrolase 1 [Motiliproteus sp.]|jgi:exosortase A-associated hydrolase 1